MAKAGDERPRRFDNDPADQQPQIGADDAASRFEMTPDPMVTSEPSVEPSEPQVADSESATLPEPVEPAVVEPELVESAVVEPAPVEPEAVEPMPVEPRAVEAVEAVEPEAVEPEPAEPEAVEAVEPEPVEPEAVMPRPAEAEVGTTDPLAGVAAPALAPAAAKPENAPPVPAAADAPAAPPTGRKSGVPSKRPAGAGKLVEGVVTSVTGDEVELTLDDGRAAVINRRNFGPDNQDPREVLSPGDRAFGAELAREDPKQRVVLSRAWALKRMAWDKVMQAAGLNEPLTGKVVSVGAKGVVVDVGVRGFVPTSHLELESISDLSSYLDQVIELRVLEADPQRERLVLSRRSILLRKQRKKTQELLSSLKPGDLRRGTVTSITDYGAFVDIGGVNGLVHLSELSWRRIRRPNDVVSLGDEVEVQILDVKAKKRRIGLSIRRLTPDPLTELKVGEV
ncbi:MAG: S1 RNA-binding domain-containing protein, partial [Actinomycetia bacterium]|nr:S1 RNA-binding domain-containing protein [Actinomycetes bacterium]